MPGTIVIKVAALLSGPVTTVTTIGPDIGVIRNPSRLRVEVDPGEGSYSESISQKRQTGPPRSPKSV
jgi:hypothetical protein